MKKPTYKDPDVDLSFKSKPLTKSEAIEASTLIAKQKKRINNTAAFS